MKIVKSILYFLLLIVMIFILRIFSDFFIFETISPIFDLIPLGSIFIKERLEIAGLYFVICILLYFIVYFLKFIEKNVFWTNKWLFFKRNFLCIGVMFIILGFLSDILGRVIFFVLPLVYYFIFKKYFSDVFFINKFFLNFASVKKYFITFVIIESPFLFQLVKSLFYQDYDVDDITIYFIFSNVRYYFLIFIASWWDNWACKKAN